MENRKAYYKALVHVLCCILIILLFVLTTTKVNAISYYNNTGIISPYINNLTLKSKNTNTVEINSKKYDTPRIIENNIYTILNKYNKTISFFSKMFGFDKTFIEEDLIERNLENSEINENNIGCLTNQDKEYLTFPNPEYGISEYFIEISNMYTEKRTIKNIPYTGGSEYIEKLIMYYTNIYETVDVTLALSIGAAESGYYKVKYMLEKNNVFGGMTSSGLIVYENIEIGVLKYIKLLSNGYFEKGLITKEAIGRKYCPQINENGIKVASSHWIHLVSKAENKYKSYTNNITIEDIV